MPTERLYYDDCYVKEFTGTVTVVHADGGIELDRSAFYPESGGQAFDVGTLNGQPVDRVLEQADRVLHYTTLVTTPGETVHGEIHWERRFGLMQHHTGQHLLSAVAEEILGWSTVSVHMSPENATVEFAVADAASDELCRLEEACNQRIQQNLPVRIATHPSADGLHLRKPTERKGPVRVVSIADIDHSACGGTHVRATGEIGYLLLGRTEKIRKNTRVEFACGVRAVRLARMHVNWLSEAAAVFQTSPDSVAGLAAGQRDELHRTAKQCRALELQVARQDGRTARLALGAAQGTALCAVRRVEGGIGDPERAFAQAFCETVSGETQRSILLTVAPATGAFLACASPDSGFDAKAWLAALSGSLGVKGGGNSTLATGKTATAEDLSALVAALPSPAVELAGAREC